MESGVLQGPVQAMIPAPKVSVAVPVYNEESVLPDLLRRTLATLDSLPGGPHEIVLVDDGSSDRTWQILEPATADEPRIVAVTLSARLTPVRSEHFADQLSSIVVRGSLATRYEWAYPLHLLRS